jgi:serine/threonine-protein kinase
MQGVRRQAVTGENRPAIGDFPAGAQIAGYQIQELLGRGGMAVVYRAADVRLDRQVALKVLAPELTRDSAFRQRFIRESRSGASVDHPNIIPVFEAGEAEGVLFIAMRYVAGRDVRALIDRSGPLPPARVVNIVTQVASALDAAHARGLVHRDVKPANMLLGAVGSSTTPDHVYLSDFGLSKLSASAVSLTSTGQFLGTIDYMSPEQVEGRPTDGRTDLYALGCAAFEMMTGRPPFHRDQDLAVMWAQVSAPPPSARELRPELPAAVDQVLAKALAKSPENRQASCLEFAAERAPAALVWPRSAPSTARPGLPTELAAAARQAPPATELALGAIAGAGAAPPSVSPGPGTPPGGGRTAAAAGGADTAGRGLTRRAERPGLRGDDHRGRTRSWRAAPPPARPRPGARRDRR